MTGPSPAQLAARLRQRGGAFREIGDDTLLAAWSDTVERFRDPESPQRRRLADPLARATGLSPPALEAGLEAVLGGARRQVAAATFAAARAYEAPATPALVILAGNLPALAVQTLLPALALRRPVLFKSSRQEPHFTAAFLAALGEHLPAMRDHVATAEWRGGNRAIEDPLFAEVGRILAYGDAAATADIARRAGAKAHVYGPKTSIALIAEDPPRPETLAGLGRDIALFDQRGCLSITAIFCSGDGRRLAHGLGRELARRAREWPAGRVDLPAAATVRQWREEAALRGLEQVDLEPAVGTVILDPQGPVRPSPGLRAVRVHPLVELREALPRLSPWRGRLQGAALTGDAAWALEDDLDALGVSRFTAPGELQSAEASWHNGGRDPLWVLSRQGEGSSRSS